MLKFVLRADRTGLHRYFAPVAQLDRASDSDSEGRRFDSCRAHQTKSSPQLN